MKVIDNKGNYRNIIKQMEEEAAQAAFSYVRPACLFQAIME